jgi:hypothetical protein
VVGLPLPCNVIGQVRDRPVVVAFFDAEEPPYFQTSTMGSIRFYQDQRTGPVHSAIILDLVGHDVPVNGLENLLFITGSESDPGLETAIRHNEPDSGLHTVPTLNSYVGDLSDHHIFRENQRPYLLLTCGRWEHYHMRTDTPWQAEHGQDICGGELRRHTDRISVQVEFGRSVHWQRNSQY